MLTLLTVVLIYMLIAFNKLLYMLPNIQTFNSIEKNRKDTDHLVMPRHDMQRRHSYHNNRIFVSDDSLDRSRRESYCLGMRSSSPPVRRMSASSLQEELCARGHQLHIDPRYRDTRPIARSASSLYLSNENSLHNAGRNYYNNCQPGISHGSGLTGAGVPLRARANSACNVTQTPPPSIYIEEYTDPPAQNEQEETIKKASNESFSNFSYNEAHQPLNEDGIASVADSDEIPFIDDGSPIEESKPYVPDRINVRKSSIMTGSSNRSSSVSSKYRKTVSFDLEETAERRESISLDRETAMNKKFHTHDAISKLASGGSNPSSNESLDKANERMPLIQKIRRELNSTRSTAIGSSAAAAGYNSGSGSNSNRSSSESIERMPLLKPRRELNANRSTDGGLPDVSPLPRSYVNRRSRAHSVNVISTVASNGSSLMFAKNMSPRNSVVSIQVPNRNETNSSLTATVCSKGGRSQSHSNIFFPQQSPKKSIQSKTTANEANDNTDEDSDINAKFTTPLGAGKVREMTSFFERNKTFKYLSPLVTNVLSKSTSQLYTKNSPKKAKKKLSQQEQVNILKQLKEWSLFGTDGHDYDLQLKDSSLNSNGDDVTKNNTSCKQQQQTLPAATAFACTSTHSNIITCDCLCCANCTHHPPPPPAIHAASECCFDKCPELASECELKRYPSIMSSAKGNTVRSLKRKQQKQQHKMLSGPKLLLSLVTGSNSNNSSSASSESRNCSSCPHCCDVKASSSSSNTNLRTIIPPTLITTDCSDEEDECDEGEDDNHSTTETSEDQR